MENYERYAGALTVVFGSVIVGGLMAANIATGDKTGFLFALAAAISAWAAGPAVLFQLPVIYRGLFLIAVVCIAASIGFYV